MKRWFKEWWHGRWKGHDDDGPLKRSGYMHRHWTARTARSVLANYKFWIGAVVLPLAIIIFSN